MRGLVGGFRAALFIGFLGIYVLVIGQDWGWYSAVLMLTAYVRNDGRLLEAL